MRVGAVPVNWAVRSGGAVNAAAVLWSLQGNSHSSVTLPRGRRDNHPQQIVPRRLVEMKAAEGEWNHGLGPALKPISLLRTPAAWLPLAGDPKPPCPTAPSYVTPDNLSPSPVHGLQALGS